MDGFADRVCRLGAVVIGIAIMLAPVILFVRPLTDCQFKAVFKPEGEAEIQMPIRCFALQTIDDHVPFRLYYDPANPQRIRTSSGQDLLTNRLISQAVGLPFLVGRLAYFPLSDRRSLQLRR